MSKETSEKFKMWGFVHWLIIALAIFNKLKLIYIFSYIFIFNNLF